MTFLEKQLLRLKAVANDNPEKPEATCELIKEMIEQIEPRFNVHKRSLPVETDKVVLFNVPYTEAKEWLEKLKSKTVGGYPKVFYYDIVPVTPVDNQESVFYNPRPFVIGDENGF